MRLKYRKPLAWLVQTRLNLMRLQHRKMPGWLSRTLSMKLKQHSADTSVSEVQTEVIITDHSYIDENISITVETIDENGVVFYVADIQLSDVSYPENSFCP